MSPRPTRSDPNPRPSAWLPARRTRRVSCGVSVGRREEAAFGRSRRSRRVSSWLLFTVALTAWWLWFAPPSLGGRTTYVIVTGQSMEPTFLAGDLVLVRPQESYAIGDIITLRPNGAGQVIHRIVAGDARGWVTKGDNNREPDGWLVREAEIVGRQWMWLPGFPRCWSWLERSGLAWPTLLASIGFLVIWRNGERRERACRS